jgi:YebC/PmpR family DNA-binding regulatory protein
MSGHSKWSTIKHKKAANDAKKGKIFSKLSTQITHAAKQGGGDINMNPNLRLYVDKAKREGFPIGNIEKAIAKGTGEGIDGVTFEEATYEGFGPCKVQMIVDVLTDNKNRTVADLRKLFEEIGGALGESGSVSWNFDTKGYIVVKSGHMEKAEKFGAEDKYVKDDREEVMMNIMDIDGIEDIKEIDIEGEEGVEIYTKYSDLSRVRDEISKLGYVIEEAEIIKEAKMKKKLDEKELEKVVNAIERIEEMDDVQSVWTDLE